MLIDSMSVVPENVTIFLVLVVLSLLLPPTADVVCHLFYDGYQNLLKYFLLPVCIPISSGQESLTWHLRH